MITSPFRNSGYFDRAGSAGVPGRIAHDVGQSAKEQVRVGANGQLRVDGSGDGRRPRLRAPRPAPRLPSTTTSAIAGAIGRRVAREKESTSSTSVLICSTSSRRSASTLVWPSAA